MATAQQSLLARAWQYLGQIPAGVVQGTVADSHIKADEQAAGPGATRFYRPAILDQPGALYGVIRGALGYHDAPDSFAGRAVARSNAAVDRTNSTLGIHDPENAVQTALNIAGSLAVPGPKIPPAATALGKVARIAAETALPMRQTGVKAALATQVPLGVGIREGVDALSNSDQYHGAADAMRPTHHADEFGDGAVDEFGDAAVAPVAPPDEFGDVGHATGLVPAKSADDTHLSTIEKGAIGVLGVAGAALSMRAAKVALTKIRSGPTVTGELVGSRVISPRASKMDRVQAGVFQHDQIARNAASEFLTPDEAARFNYNSDRIIPQALGAKVKHALMTGELPGSTVKAKPLAPLLQAIATDVDPPSRQVLADGLLAKSALDDYRATGVQSAFNDKTPAELQAMVDLVDNDPKLSKYADGVRDQYRSLLDYRKEQGFLDAQTHADFRAKRPNYVHMSRDISKEGGPSSLFQGNGANNLTDEQFSRQMEEFGGVQTGATRDPIDELQSRYGATIRAAQMNAHKRELFDGLSGTRATSELVPTSDGASVKLLSELHDEPKSMDGVHIVWDGGKARYFKVGDPALDRALRYSPRATTPVLGQMRQIAQFFTTGAGNPLSMFGATVSPVYDTLTGMVLRPQGTDLGVINEALNRMGSPVNLGRADPTALLSAPIGALRSAHDELTGSWANSLSTQLMRDHGAVLDMLGPQKTTALRDMLQSRYDSSIRSMLDSEGVSSHQQWGADSGRGMPIGLEEVAPDYASNLASRVRAESLSGNHSLYEGVLANGKNAFAQMKSNVISRMYSGVLRNMQEGFRYQFAATNLPKVKSMQQLNELMSTTRRIASDPGQYGGSDTWNQIADSVMYANVGTQAMSEWARRFAKSPVYTTSNLLTTVGTLAALRYGAMIADPDVAQKVQSRTDMQNASSIPTFGGMDIPVEPMIRVLTAPLFSVIDHIAMDGEGKFHPSFVDAIYNYFDDDDKSAHETLNASAKASFLAGLQSAMPVDVAGPLTGNTAGLATNLPAGNLAFAMAGVDPAFSRMSGNVVPVRVQQQSELQGQGKTTDSMVSGYFENLINSVAGSGVTNLIDIADQWQRAAYSQNRDGSRGVSPAGAAKVALSQLVDEAARTTGPVQGLLFGNYEKVHSIADTDFQLYQGKRDGIDKATKIFRDDIKNQFVTGSDPRTALWRPQDLVPPDYSQTALAPIGAIALDLHRTLYKMEKHTSDLGKQIDVVRNQKTTRIEERNKQINEINKERRYMYGVQLRTVRMAEDAVGQAINDPSFTFQSFAPEKYVASTSQSEAPQ